MPQVSHAVKVAGIKVHKLHIYSCVEKVICVGVGHATKGCDGERDDGRRVNLEISLFSTNAHRIYLSLALQHCLAACLWPL